MSFLWTKKRKGTLLRLACGELRHNGLYAQTVTQIVKEAVTTAITRGRRNQNRKIRSLALWFGDGASDARRTAYRRCIVSGAPVTRV